jgi:hypothetical protein
MIREGVMLVALLCLLVTFGWLNRATEPTLKTHVPAVSEATSALPSNPLDLSSVQESLVAIPNNLALNSRGTIYVPAYSAIRVGTGKGKLLELAVTLSLQNTSNHKPLVLEQLNYHDTNGSLVWSYLGKPVALKPFGTIEIFIPHNDLRGGTGANFIVKWAGEAPMAEPLAEVMMVGLYGSAGFSFVTQGRRIEIKEAQAIP